MLMRSREVPDSISIIVKGNPEYISESLLASVTDELIEQAILRLVR